MLGKERLWQQRRACCFSKVGTSWKPLSMLGVELVEALATADFAERHAVLLERLPPGVLHWVEPSLLAASADSDAPQGLVAIAHREQAPLDECPRDGLVVYLDGIQDPGNLGAIARSAEAFGASALVVSPGSSHWRHPRALRGSAGSLLRLPCFPGVTPEALDEVLRASAPWWVLTKGGDCPLEDLTHSPSAVLVLGSESHGPRGVLAAETLAPRQRQVSIPIAASVESLNVAVAGSIALHALRRT